MGFDSRQRCVTLLGVHDGPVLDTQAPHTHCYAPVVARKQRLVGLQHRGHFHSKSSRRRILYQAPAQADHNTESLHNQGSVGNRHWKDVPRAFYRNNEQRSTASNAGQAMCLGRSVSNLVSACTTSTDHVCSSFRHNCEQA